MHRQIITRRLTLRYLGGKSRTIVFISLPVSNVCSALLLFVFVLIVRVMWSEPLCYNRISKESFAGAFWILALCVFGGGGALHCNFPFVTSANLFERGGGGGGGTGVMFPQAKEDYTDTSFIPNTGSISSHEYVWSQASRATAGRPLCRHWMIILFLY